MMYAYLILSWIGFGFIHSLTAAQWLKRQVEKTAGPLYRYYRLAYNGLAVLTFLPVLILHQKAPLDYVNSWHGESTIGKGFIGLGLLIGIIALRGYDLAEFIGWPVKTRSSVRQELRQTGLLHYVRHPLYTGIILTLLGVWLNVPSWSNLILLLAATLYIRIGIYFEERKLVDTFGNAYRQYRSRVPMLLPRLSAFYH